MSEHHEFTGLATKAIHAGYRPDPATGTGTGFKNKSGKPIIALYVLANNIFDVAYQDHLSRLKYFEQYTASPNGHLGIYSMGRNLSIKLVKNF